MKIQSLFFFLAILTFTASCGLFNRTTGNATLPRKRSAQYLLKRMQKQAPRVEWLDAKIKLDVESPDQRIKLTSHLRLRRDSLIWMNFKKFGIEAARLLITPDSAFFINRLDRTYFAERLSDLAKAYDIPADFGQLQALLLGYPAVEAAQTEVLLDPGAYLLVNNTREVTDTLRLDAQTFLPESWHLRHADTGLQAEMTFENYQKLDSKHFFSYFRALKTMSKSGEGVHLVLEFSKLRLNEPVNMPFQIPGRYDRIR